jgi:hypothetical protein
VTRCIAVGFEQTGRVRSRALAWQRPHPIGRLPKRRRSKCNAGEVVGNPGARRRFARQYRGASRRTDRRRSVRVSHVNASLRELQQVGSFINLAARRVERGVVLPVRPTQIVGQEHDDVWRVCESGSLTRVRKDKPKKQNAKGGRRQKPQSGGHKPGVRHLQKCSVPDQGPVATANASGRCLALVGSIDTVSNGVKKLGTRATLRSV